METFSALLAICAGNSPVTGEFPAQRPVARSFDVSFDLCPNKRLSKQSWDWWIETQSCPQWRYCNNYSDELLRSINSFASRGCDCYFNSVISSFFIYALWTLHVKFLSAECQRTPLMTSQHLFRLSLDTVGNNPLPEPMLIQICVTV